MNCILCENSGIHYASNGPDDFLPEYCSCPEGKKAEDASVGTVMSSFSKLQQSVEKLQRILNEPTPPWFLYEQGRKAGETPGDAWAMARDIN